MSRKIDSIKETNLQSIFNQHLIGLVKEQKFITETEVQNYPEGSIVDGFDISFVPFENYNTILILYPKEGLDLPLRFFFLNINVKDAHKAGYQKIVKLIRSQFVNKGKGYYSMIRGDLTQDYGTEYGNPLIRDVREPIIILNDYSNRIEFSSKIEKKLGRYQTRCLSSYLADINERYDIHKLCKE